MGNLYKSIPYYPSRPILDFAAATVEIGYTLDGKWAYPPSEGKPSGECLVFSKKCYKPQESSHFSLIFFIGQQ